MTICCEQDQRRDAVRRLQGWNGIDYIEVGSDQLSLMVYFLGKLPPELAENKPGLEKYLQITGGQRISDIKIVDVDPIPSSDPEKDDVLIVYLDKAGDFSTYTLRLVAMQNIDPRYDHADFSFKIDCPSDLDCVSPCGCEPPVFPQPEINYLAKDYGSFRQLILDRLALLMPDWKERHVPDIGITLVELLAYVGDYLSYYQDAVATEAYLDTARQRISVRRHVRLVDYQLHEGCNARAWLSMETSSDLELDASTTSFITGINDALTAKQSILKWEDLREVPKDTYEVFEPFDRTGTIKVRTAHNEIHIYTWGRKECCIERGSTSVTLLDSWLGEGDGRARALQLEPGDVLIFEEVLSPTTGLAADADPTKRHAVRLVKVTPGEDPIVRTAAGDPTPYLIVEWGAEDALPFTLCVSSVGGSPDCKLIHDVTVARGNVILVDHGRTLDPEDLGVVEATYSDISCECEGRASETSKTAARYRPSLKWKSLTFRQSLIDDSPLADDWASAEGMLRQDCRAALPQIWLSSEPSADWAPHYDLIGSSTIDHHFVVEIDNDGIAHLRFGDGELGFRPEAGTTFHAVYRIGNGVAGNVGAESISRIVLKNTSLDGVSVVVRNPLAAKGGANSEPIAEAKLFAPHHFRKRLERAIIAPDYEVLAERNPKVQQASAQLVWTGSWYEADVAIDPFGASKTPESLMDEIERYLENYRRIGHDLHIEPATYVALDLEIEACALPNYQRGHVKAALLDVFSNRILRGGAKGFFHPDNRTFGDNIYVSQIVALAQAVPGVECARVSRLQRLFQPANGEIENGVLPLQTGEIVLVDNDPNHPENGKLSIVVKGGR